MIHLTRFALLTTTLLAVTGIVGQSQALATPSADMAVLVAAAQNSAATLPSIQFEDEPTCNDSDNDGECDEGGFQKD